MYLSTAARATPPRIQKDQNSAAAPSIAFEKKGETKALFLTKADYSSPPRVTVQR